MQYRDLDILKAHSGGKAAKEMEKERKEKNRKSDGDMYEEIAVRVK